MTTKFFAVLLVIGLLVCLIVLKDDQVAQGPVEAISQVETNLPVEYAPDQTTNTTTNKVFVLDFQELKLKL